MTSNHSYHPNVVTREIESRCWNIGKKIWLIVFDALCVEFDVKNEGQILSLILGCMVVINVLWDRSLIHRSIVKCSIGFYLLHRCNWIRLIVVDFVLLLVTSSVLIFCHLPKDLDIWMEDESCQYIRGCLESASLCRCYR
jgi:hypothetical protein